MAEIDHKLVGARGSESQVPSNFEGLAELSGVATKGRNFGMTFSLN